MNQSEVASVCYEVRIKYRIFPDRKEKSLARLV